MHTTTYDIIIIGAGPAGLTAALYAGRSKLNTLIIERGLGGGQIAITDEVANYPGSVHHEGEIETTGPELVKRMIAQAEHFGAKKIAATVTNVDFTGEIKKVITANGTVYTAKSIIIATGALPKKLGCPGEAEFTGKGVSYCATCDADFFTDFEVFCVGGGYTAVEEAIYLSKFARKVNLVVRKDHVRCALSVLEKAQNNPKIEIQYNTEILEIRGDGIVESALMYNNKTGEKYEYHADENDGTFGIFMFIGFNPNTELFKGHVNMDDHGYILTDENMLTNIPGIFAAGDLRPKLLRQVVTATADGAIAATAAEKYISEHFKG
ncbi:MAG: thioredoxin-disulfide reductase [Fusobacteriaceae bacterium]|nr:thioredoxin-disulfide reductase [Fusobacteriaceae bacterium]MBP9510489.1 thioredoxin-disulfide reductase [Fusobacteriaceae bacterium]